MSADSFRGHFPLWPSLALVALVFTVDLNLPLGVASAVPYLFAVLLAGSARPPWAGFAVALLCMVLTVLKMELYSDRGTTELWKVIANRGLAIVAIGIVAVLGWRRQRAEDAREAAESSLHEQREELARMARVRTLGEAAAWLAHELNQPLATIGLQVDLAAEMARKGPAKLPELTGFLNQAVAQVARAADIVKSLRRLAGGVRATHDLVDLNQVIEDTVRLMTPHGDRAGVTLRTSLKRPTPAVLGDRVQLQQVLVNLIQNAMDAAASLPGQGQALEKTVHIASDISDNDLEIRVSDTGPGFANLDRAFERFHTTKPQGLGLGLAICKEIVAVHGGLIEAKSGPAPFATTLLVRLPIPTGDSP